ncbi:30S ribosomal protein S15, partial [Mycoplasmopsis pullorum]
FHSRRGFLAKITQRKTLLAYLKKNDPETYLKCLEEFKLRK